jgi:hypothetical protein
MQHVSCCDAAKIVIKNNRLCFSSTDFYVTIKLRLKEILTKHLKGGG